MKIQKNIIIKILIKWKHNEYYLQIKNEKLKKYEDNKETINQKQRDKIICDCAISISRGYYSAHIKSKCHNNNIIIDPS